MPPAATYMYLLGEKLAIVLPLSVRLYEPLMICPPLARLAVFATKVGVVVCALAGTTTRPVVPPDEELAGVERNGSQNELVVPLEELLLPEELELLEELEPEDELELLDDPLLLDDELPDEDDEDDEDEDEDELEPELELESWELPPPPPQPVITSAPPSNKGAAS